MMKLYWKAIWGEPSVVNAHPHAGHGYFSNEAFEKLLADAKKKGAEEARFEHERNGIVIFGQDLRRKLEYWRTVNEHSDDVPSVPLWDLDNLIEQYNIPEAEDDGAEG